MSRPYRGAHEARQAAADLEDSHARDAARTWLDDFDALGRPAADYRKARDNMQERLDRGETLPGLNLAAIAQIVRLLTDRLGGA